MTDQLALWGGSAPVQLAVTHPTSRRTDPGTSRDAAVLAMVGAPSLRERCLAALREHGPMTDHQLADKVGRTQPSAGKRRLDLERAGLVELVYGDDGKPLRRLTPSGATALVWRAVL